MGKLMIGALLCAALMVGCREQERSQTAEKEHTQEPGATAGGSTEDNTEEIVFNNAQGEPVALSSLRGKLVFINFWATWCPPCIEEMPSIDALYQSYKDRDDVVFITVDVDNKIQQSTAFMEKNGYQLPVYTPASQIPESYLAGAIPTTVILAPSGEMIGRLEGGRDYSEPEFVTAFDDLVNELP